MDIKCLDLVFIRISAGLRTYRVFARTRCTLYLDQLYLVCAETELLCLWCLKECLLCIPYRLMRHRGMGWTGRKEVWVRRSLVSWVENVWRKSVMPGKMGGVRVLTRVANDHLVGHCVGPYWVDLRSVLSCKGCFFGLDTLGEILILV